MLTQSQGLCFSLCPAGKEAWDVQGTGRRHSQDSWAQLTKGISHTKQHHTQQWNWEELAVSEQLHFVLLVFTLDVPVLFGVFCLFGFFYWCCSFVCIVAVCCFFLNELPLPQLTNFLTFLLILWREVSKQLCGTWLPTGVKPQLQDSWHSRSICRVPTNNLKLCYSQHYLNWCAF